MSDTTLFLMVGLPGAGKTTRARELAASHDVLRLTPDEWHLPFFGTSLSAEGKRDLLEGWLITVALRTLRLGTSVVLDFGLWGRDEHHRLHLVLRHTADVNELVHKRRRQTLVRVSATSSPRWGSCLSFTQARTLPRLRPAGHAEWFSTARAVGLLVDWP